MSKKPTISETLTAAIERSGLTLYRIAEDSGVSYSNVHRFARGDMAIRLAAADRLAAYLGLHLVPDPDAVPPKPTPEDRARPMLAKRKRKTTPKPAPKPTPKPKPTRRPANKRKAKG